MQGISSLLSHDYGFEIDCSLVYLGMCSVGLPAGNPMGADATLSSAAIQSSSFTQVIFFVILALRHIF